MPKRSRVPEVGKEKSFFELRFVEMLVIILVAVLTLGGLYGGLFLLAGFFHDTLPESQRHWGALAIAYWPFIGGIICGPFYLIYLAIKRRHVRGRGYRAFREGVPETQCPYAPHSAEWSVWQTGWNKAKEDYRKPAADRNR